MRPKAVVRLLRPHHCVKNVLVLCPLFFNGRLFDPSRWGEAAVAFAAFTCVAAAVYALNDCMDARRDRLHPTKRFRPVASGEVSRGAALALAGALCAAAAGALACVRAPGMALAWLGAYVAVNVLYSLGLALTFYALWAANQPCAGLIWTVPVALLILMRYELAADADADGDPVEVLLHDPFMLALCALYGAVLLALLYLPGLAA